MRLGFRRKTRSCLILTGILFITMIICLKPEPLAVLVSIPYILGQNQSSTGSPELESDSCVQARTKPSFVICTHNMNEDIYVSRSLQTTGIWEPKMTKIFQSILTTNKNTTVIDVGANVGYFTLLAASLGSNIIAIEPIDKNIQKLVHGVLVNNFQDKIVILRNVISRARGVVRLDISSDTNQGAARVIMETEVTSSSKTTKIASIVLDDLVKFIKTQNVVIKVDIEGHECRALEKSMLLFERFNVTYIFTEWSKMTSVRHRYGVACPPEHIRKMCRNLTKRGFIPYDITYNKPLDPKLCDRWRYNDVYWKSNKLV